MVKLILYALPFLAMFAPNMWVHYVFRKNDEHFSDMPFTAHEFGKKIIDESKLKDVSIESIKEGDHYDPTEKKVCIVKDRLDKKSITSISIVCHEIGHAIQDKENYPPLKWRNTLIKKSSDFQAIGALALFIVVPIFFAITKSIFITLIGAFVAFAFLSTNVFIHLVTLPLEFDASFKRALPILQKYVPKENLQQCKSVLKAAALTYVAGSIVSIFRMRRIFMLILPFIRMLLLRR